MATTEFASFDPESILPQELHAKLLGGIAPRPIAFASTVDAKGRPNLAPFSYFNVFSAQPPIVIFSPARRLRDNTTKHTLDNVHQHPEVVINLVDYNMVHQCSLASADFEAGISEFDKAGLTALASERVSPLRVAESPVQLECRVVRVDSLGEKGGAGQLVICEVLRMHFRKDVLDDSGKPDPDRLDLVGRCGGATYVRVSGAALFQLPKPLSRIGIGVDALPEEVRLSRILSGNDLGQLGGISELPSETDVNDYKLMELADLFMEHEDSGQDLEEALHRYAVSQIAQGDIIGALKALMAFNPG